MVTERGVETTKAKRTVPFSHPKPYCVDATCHDNRDDDEMIMVMQICYIMVGVHLGGA
jgi:hypothetical protein